MKRILIFLAVTFALTWTFWGVAVSGPVATGIPVATQLLVGLGMFCPMIGAVVTWFILRKKQPFSLYIRPKLRGNGRFYLFAWLAPTALALCGAALYFLVFRQQFDPQMGYLRETAGAAGIRLSIAQLRTSALIQCIVGVFVGPLLNILAGFGEEVGWRGLLYPALREKLPPVGTCLVGGVIWGLWHAPITMRGHNYGFGYPGFPVAGILTMCVFCFALGTLLFWLSEKTRSVWPAALMHGAVNAIVGAPLLVLPSAETGSRLLGPSVSGLLAGLPILLLAMVLLWKSRSGSVGKMVKKS